MSKLFPIFSIIAIVVLGVIVVLNATRLRELGTRPIAPNVTESRPEAATADVCTLSFNVSVNVCDGWCNSDDDCSGGFECNMSANSDPNAGFCRNPECTTIGAEGNCQCPAQCNDVCETTSDCENSEHICVIVDQEGTKRCRDNRCTESAACACPSITPTPTSTPTNTPTPSNTPVPTATPTSIPSSTPTPSNTPIPSSTPTSTPTNTPQPSATPTPMLACVDLTSNNSAPQLNDTITLSCQASQVSAYFQFRYSLNGNSYQMLATSSVNQTTGNASFTITDPGNYVFECQACSTPGPNPDPGTCTTWGAAN